MIAFDDLVEDPKLLKKTVRWAQKNRDHIPSLSALAPRRSLSDLTRVAKAWQASGYGRLFEISEDGVRTVAFSLNEAAVAAVDKVHGKSLRGRVEALPIAKGVWDIAKISLGALIGWLLKSFSG